jgi:antitoxin component HigA of HigAB toxin-antitoxin module
MATNKIAERQRLALEAIKQAFGTEAGEDSINLFVEHHLAELPEAYWKEHLAIASPDPGAVLSLLQFRSSWGEDDLEHFDFTLPGEVTNYVVSVRFDSAGNIDEISMES